MQEIERSTSGCSSKLTRSYFENKKAKNENKQIKKKTNANFEKCQKYPFFSSLCNFYGTEKWPRIASFWVNFYDSKLRKLTQIKWKISSLSCATLNGMIVRWGRNSFTDSLSLRSLLWLLSAIENLSH